ncbi:MAG: adenosylcobinamide-GDP ribazoletransferase [Novosphingobium sp.]
MKGLIVATQFLTRLPTPRVRVSDSDFARSMRWFPAVGVIMGGIVAGGGWLGAMLDPWVGTIFALVLWVVVTGALHLDGLGDIADAAGAAHKDRERLLQVLADPHIGSFGVVAIVLQLLAKLVLLHALLEEGAVLALVAVPFVARMGPLLWTRMLPNLHDGLASRFREAVRPVDIALWSIALAVAAWFVPALLATPLLLLMWQSHVRRTLGGISGDGHGAGIELVETGLLVAILIAGRLAL